MVFDRMTPFNELPLLPPKIETDSKSILRKAISANKILAELKGTASLIPNPSILINSLTLQEARSSSEIENVLTTSDDLFKGFAVSEGRIDPQTKEVLRYREALWNGYTKLKKKSVFGTNLFIDIYKKIIQTDEGIRINPGTRVANGRNRIVYSPPEGERLIRDKLKNLEKFVHDDEDRIDLLVKLAIMHYQFEAIHPFTDGNGRTGRILCVLYLVHKKLLDLPVLYLSQYIIKEKTQYYRMIRNVTERNEWEAWILFMLDAVEKTSSLTIDKILKIKSLFEDTLELAKQKLPSYVYSKELIELLFEQPYCKIQFLVRDNIAKRQRASVYLKELQKIGILKQEKVGKEKLYLNRNLFKLLQE